MHKSFIITESEREKILGLHKSATNRQYLNEAKNPEVTKVQEKLISLGGDLGKFGADGVLGPITLKAIFVALKDIPNVGETTNQEPAAPDNINYSSENI